SKSSGVACPMFKHDRLGQFLFVGLRNGNEFFIGDDLSGYRRTHLSGMIFVAFSNPHDFLSLQLVSNPVGASGPLIRDQPPGLKVLRSSIARQTGRRAALRYRISESRGP